MKTIHLISHTHWDREWYRTFQQFRLRLVHLVDGLLDILATDRDYKHFMLDGQTIVLDDYLQMRPEAEPILRKHIHSGRVLIGPWHILPDMFLVSPEAHIRNLLAGERVASHFGPKMMIGYMPDSFGHIGQMPQILQGFGIDNACLWRGVDDQPTEFWWQSPDGTRVLMLFLRDSYGNGASLNTDDPKQFAEQIRQAADSLAPHSHTSDLLVMHGTDHMEPPRGTSSAIRSANKLLKGYRVVHSTLPDYLAAVQRQLKSNKANIPVVSGELRSSKRAHLLPGVLSTRMWIKQDNHACENLLEKWAEPFSTFASLVTERTPETALREPASILRQAWMLLLQNHPHDSICGCSINQVHDEMRPRFDQVEQIGEEITRQSLETLAGAVDTTSQSSRTGNQPVIVVFNPLSTNRTDLASAEIKLPYGTSDFDILDDAGNLIPHQSTSGKTSDLINANIRREELSGLISMIHEGRVINMALQDMQFTREGSILNVEAVFAENADPNIEVWNNTVKAFEEYTADKTIETFHIHAYSLDSTSILFTAPDVPALGWKTLYVRGKQSTPTEIHITPIMQLLAPLAKLRLVQKFLASRSTPRVKPPYLVENDFFTVELNPSDRTLSITDKVSGKVLHGLNRFVDNGDCGDEYNFSPPMTDIQVDITRLEKVTIQRGPVQQTMTASLIMKVPASLGPDRKTRSEEMVEIPIKTTVTLTSGVPRIDVHTCVDNRAKDHRLRVHFPAPIQVESADYDGHFEIVKRPVGIPAYDETWAEEPRPETHQRVFTTIADGASTLTVANRGLPEVEVLQAAGKKDTQIAITLLRCVSWLSRDDFSTRKSHAGPFLETTSAQMLGEWEFDYSIIPGQAANQASHQAWSFDAPLRTATTGIHKGSLPASGSFIQVENPSFVVSAVKETEDRRGWILRGYNIREEDITLNLKPWRRFRKVDYANMAEKPVKPLKVDKGGGVSARVRGHEVLTIMFRD